MTPGSLERTVMPSALTQHMDSTVGFGVTAMSHTVIMSTAVYRRYDFVFKVHDASHETMVESGTFFLTKRMCFQCYLIL